MISGWFCISLMFLLSQPIGFTIPGMDGQVWLSFSFSALTDIKESLSSQNALFKFNSGKVMNIYNDSYNIRNYKFRANEWLNRNNNYE